MTDIDSMNPLQDIVVARQPIFDRRKEVFAYELLFKSDFHERFDCTASAKKKRSTSKTVDTLMVGGLKRLTSGKRAVINFNRKMLMCELPRMFPADLLGIEVLEDADETLNKTVKKLKKSGYLLIVNDDIFNTGDIKLIKMADIVGVDFRSPGIHKRFSIFDNDPARPRFLAKSVETASDYDVAADKGYQYFQGGFFSSVELISVRNIPSSKVNFMRILKEINKPTVEFERIEEILKRDVSITFKLLRFINASSFGFKSSVQSIRHALNLLGEEEVRKWLSLIVLSSVGTDRPQELVKNTLVRAKFCESIAVELNRENEKSNFFLMGMFSMVDALLGRPMDEILLALPLHRDIKDALLGKPGVLADVMELIRDYEKGFWRRFDALLEKLELDAQKICSLYFDAIEWGKLL